MVDELFNLDDLLNYDKYQETIPQYSFKESLADVAPSSVITSNTVPSLSQSVGVTPQLPARESSSRTNDILKSFSGLLSENNNALPLDTSNQQLAEIAATSLAPALIGLIMKGKQGAGVGALIGGKAGEALAQRQRAEAIKQAELTNVNQREQRQILNNLLSNATAEERIAAQERIAEANRAADRADSKTSFENQLKLIDARDENKVKAEETKVRNENNQKLADYAQINTGFNKLGAEVEPQITSDGRVGDPKSLKLDKARTSLAQYATLQQKFVDFFENYNQLDAKQRSDTTKQLILDLKADAINKGGSAFSNLEYALNSAGIPKDFLNLDSANITSDSLTAVSQWLNKADPIQSLIDVAKNYQMRTENDLGSYGIKLNPYIEQDGKQIPTVWGRINSYQSTYDKLKQNANPALDKYKSTGSSMGSTVSNRLTFNMDRAKEIFNQRKQQGVNK